MKFHVEAWRVIKFILITVAVYLPTSVYFVHFALHAPSETCLSLLGYTYVILNALVLTIVHRYFTFRATTKWYIAIPIMMVTSLVWHVLLEFLLSIAVSSIADLSNYLWAMWFFLQYLLQRCVIYCHTTDQNGWYRRFHPDTKEGVHPNE